jgi:Protein of unknown function (DUF3892)
MCVQVKCVGRAADGDITHIGGSADDGSKRWGLTRAQAIQRIRSNEWSFFVRRPAADPVAVRIRSRAGQDFLTTARDDTETNNLGVLPDCNPPLEGTDPQLPLSFPGRRVPALVELVGRAGSGGPTVIAPTRAGVFKIPGWKPSVPLKRVRLTCLIPFPGHLEVCVERHPADSDYVEATHKLPNIDSSLPAQIRNREDQGQGWYDWTLTIPDSSYPRRFTPVRVPVGIPEDFGDQDIVTVYLRSVSYNPHCGGPSDPLPVVLYRTSQSPPFIPGGSSPGTSPTAPPREYKEGAFTAWQPAVRNVGQSAPKGADRRVDVKSAQELMTSGWPQFGVYVNPASEGQLCEPVGFAVLTGQGTAQGGIGFSGSGDLGVALAMLQPNVPGHSGDVLFRFVKLGAPGSVSMDAPGFLTTPQDTITPRILLDPAEQVALVVDANRFGGFAANPGRARLLDMGNGAAPLVEIPFDGSQISAVVNEKADGKFEAAITADGGITRVDLPEK